MFATKWTTWKITENDKPKLRGETPKTSSTTTSSIHNNNDNNINKQIQKQQHEEQKKQQIQEQQNKQTMITHLEQTQTTTNMFLTSPFIISYVVFWGGACFYIGFSSSCSVFWDVLPKRSTAWQQLKSNQLKI